METNIIKNLQEKVAFYKEEIQKIENAIDVIRKNSGQKPNEVSERKPRAKKEKAGNVPSKKVHPSSKKPISKQVLEYLSESSRFLYPNNIIETLAARSGKKPDSVKLLVNQTLSRLKKENKLVSFKSDHSRSHAWGFQTWLNNENLPLHEHQPENE